MTVEEVTIIVALWTADTLGNPKFPETVLLGGSIGLWTKMINGMAEHPKIRWGEWQRLADKWMSENKGIPSMYYSLGPREPAIKYD